MNIAVIGAGISGISCAQLLKEKGHTVKLFEKNKKAGGLVKCDYTDGNLFHRVGGHVFNSRNKEVLDWFWKFFDKENEFIQAKRNAKIFMQGNYLGYPLENYLYLLEKELLGKIINEILDLDNAGYKAPDSYANFEDFLKGNFGETLYKIYFKPYNEKIWKTDLSKVSLEWLDGKLPMPNYRETILSNILQVEESTMVHSSFFYAKKDGSQFIVDRLVEGVDLITDFEVKTISKNNDKWSINNDEKLIFDKIIYSGDLRKLSNIIKVEDELQEALSNCKDLQSNGTTTALCESDSTDISWLYLPDADIDSHRIIYTGNFSPNNNQTPDGRISCTVEFSGLDVTEETIKKQLIQLPGNLKLIEINREPNSYVIQRKGDQQHIKDIKTQLALQDFHLLGRFAEWEYYNMDKAIEAGMDLVDSFK